MREIPETVLQQAQQGFLLPLLHPTASLFLENDVGKHGLDLLQLQLTCTRYGASRVTRHSPCGLRVAVIPVLLAQTLFYGVINGIL